MTLNFEDYVRGVHYLCEEYGVARPVALARRLNVSKNTVSRMVQVLVGKGLLEHEGYSDIRLTGRGRQLARRLTYRHRLIERFLSDVLGVRPSCVHLEADRLEHGFSSQSITGLERLLKHPSACPHGRPLSR